MDDETREAATRQALETMRAQEAVGDLVDALAKAQANFAEVKKSKTAEIPGKDGRSGYSYSYADLSDLIAAIRKPLADEGIAWGQDATTSQGAVTTTSQGAVTTTLWFRKGEQILTFGPFSLPASGLAQQYGSALTYARRYQLSAALGIASEDDDDGQLATIGAGASSNRGTKKATQKQLAALHALGAKKGKDHEALRDIAGLQVGVESLKELSSTDAAAFMDELAKLPDVPTDAEVIATIAEQAADRTTEPEGDAREEAADPSAPVSDLEALRAEAKELIGGKTTVLQRYRAEFKPEGTVSYDKITADELALLVAMAKEAQGAA